MYWSKIFSKEQSQFSDKECTEDEITKLSRACKDKYATWKTCNNTLFKTCKTETLEDYYICVDKLNAIRLHLEKQRNMK